VQKLVARGIFRLQERLLGRRTFSILRRLEQSQWFPRERIRQLQLARLGELLAAAYEHTPYWREVMDANGVAPETVASLEDLRRLPLLEKATIRARREQMAWPGEGPGVRLARTSGSTSGALAFYTSASREAAITAARIRGHRWIGIDVGDTEVYFWGAPVELSGMTRLKRLRDRLANTPLSSASVIDAGVVREHAAAWRRCRANCLFGYPSSFCLFARVARQVGVDLTDLPAAGLRAICTTAEMLTERDRATIRNAFGVPVYDSYGLREGGLVGHECEHLTMHTVDEQLILETIDPGTGRPTAGEGELVLTNLTSRVMPVIRYRTGDRVALSARPCPCGRSLGRVKVAGGRLHDFVVTGDGRWVGSIAFSRICSAVPGIVKFQVRQERLSEIRLLLAVDEDFPADGAARAAAAARARLADGDRLAVEIVDDIKPAPSGKYRPVVSKVAEQLRRSGRYVPAPAGWE